MVLTTSGNCGNVAYIDDEPEFPTVATNFVRILRVDPSVANPRYIFHFLRSPRFTSALVPYIRGATIKNLSVRSAFANLDVPLPSREEQRRIAAILDHADALRVQRRQVVAKLDDLAGSVFGSTFGDVRGDRWDVVRFGDAVPRIENGRSPNCEARAATSSEWGVLKLGAVTYGRFRPDENKAYLGKIGGLAEHEVRSGDVLMTRKNTRELVGAVALVEEVRPKLVLPDLIFRLHLDAARIERRYFQAMMMSPQMRSAVRNLSSGSASSMPNISKSRLANLPLPLPPLSLQQEFAERVQVIEANRARVQAALGADDELFASLQSRAFRGEL